MPYNPQVGNHVADYYASSLGQLQQTVSRNMEQGKSNLAQALMWMMDRSMKTKELKSYVKTALPDVDTSKMTLEDMTGMIQGKAAQAQAHQNAMAEELQQQKLAEARAVEPNRLAMQAAMRDSSPMVSTTENVLRPDLGAGGGGLPGVGDVTVRARQNPTLQSLFSAMTQHPGSEETAAGKSVLAQLWRDASGGKGGGPVEPIPWSVGEMSGVVEPKTGRIALDPKTEASLANAKRKPAAAEEGPGKGPLLSDDGKFYWDGHLKSWKALPAATKGKGGLFDGASTAPAYKSADEVGAAYKAGKLSYEEAAKVLKDDFGVK